jgi:ACS family tartrate transporter-like MFS transporter
LAGWRWLFILEGIPAILLGIVTIFYLTDWPSEARWLPADERNWLTAELQAELQAKKRIRDHTIPQALSDSRVLLMAAVWLLALSGYIGNVYWLPTFVKRLSGFSDREVTTLLIVPALVGIFAIIANGWHSDKSGERRFHAAIPVLVAASMYGLLIAARDHIGFAISFLLLGSGFLLGLFPVFMSIPTLILGESAAAAGVALINSIAQLGGLAGPYLIGLLNDRTHSPLASFAFIALVYFAAAILILSLKIRDPLQSACRLDLIAATNNHRLTNR